MAQQAINGRARVLVVEDEGAIRRLMTVILRQKGFVVDEATNGLEALDCVQQNAPYHLVVTDLAMPEMDGVTMLKRLREWFPALPAIIVSAHTSANWAQDVVDYGYVTLAKPFNHAQFVQAIQTFFPNGPSL
jgi:CheY-like chemotaxis protein